MKKFLRAMIAIVAVAVLAFTLAGCSKSGSVKKAFEDEGYTVSTVDATSEEAKSLMTLLQFTDDQKKDAESYELIVCKKGLNSALVIKYSSADEIKEFMGGEDKYNTAKEKGTVNGDCAIFTLSPAAIEIFKKA